jgi:glutaredoxin
MALIYHLYTPASAWCALDVLATAVNAQAGLQAQVTAQGNELRIHCVLKQQVSVASMQPLDAAGFARLMARENAHINQSEYDAMPPLQRLVVLTTATEDGDSALCHVTIADALWWLLGGFLANPATQTLWSRKGWRGSGTLREQAAALVGRAAAPLPKLPPPVPLPPAGSMPMPATGVTVYTLPYCRHCRELVQRLNERGVSFEEVDLAGTPGAADIMLRLNTGQRAAPTIRIGTQVFVGPEPEELDTALRAAGLL